MVFCLHVYLHEGVGSSGTGAIDSWELPRVNAMWVGAGNGTRSSRRPASAVNP